MKRPDHARVAEIQVPFHDCDPLGIVWHGHYFKYFEIARCALFRSVNLDVPDLVELDIRMFVSEVRCRYTAPLRYRDVVRVTAWFTETEPLLKVAYDVENLTSKRRCVRASTRLALADKHGNLLDALPESVRRRIPRDA